MTAHCPSCHDQFDLPYVCCPHDGTVLLVADEDFAVGAIIGTKYRLVGQIAGGAVSSVYEALHQDFATRLALKVLRREFCTSDRQIDRFQTEAKCAIGLVHPHVVRVFDFGTSPQPHIAMEFIEGKTLAQLLQENGAMPWQRALEVMSQVVDGMSAVHAADLIHRDIKPSNIIIDGRSGTVKIIDFGVAKDILELHRNTRTGETLGSPPYMSPEQCRGQPLDARSDIYSFGCTLYELLTDVRPFAGKTFMESMFKHLENEAPPLKKTRRDLRFPVGLDRLLDRCLAIEPAKRYRSAAELKQDLDRVRNGRGSAVAKVKKAKKPSMLRYLLMIAAFFIVAAVIISIGFFMRKLGTNELATGAAAKFSQKEIAVNGPVELDGLTRDQIYKMRAKIVDENAQLLAAPYKPYNLVFGDIGDKLPWWGMKGVFWYASATGPTAVDGPSYHSPAVVNPFLLVSIDFGSGPDWQKQIIGDPDQIADFPYCCLADRLIWQPGRQRFDVTYRVNDWRRRVAKLNHSNANQFDQPVPEGDLNYCNAEDFGYEYMTYSVEDQTGRTDSPEPEVFGLMQHLHRGSTCGYPCNTMGEDMYHWCTIKPKPPSTVHIRLWKKRPATKGAPPDLIGFIHLV